MFLLVVLALVIVVGAALAVLFVPRAVARARAAAVREAEERALVAIGRAHGQLAHDLGNMLTVLRLNAEELQDSLGAEHPGLRATRAIEEATDLGSSLARQLAASGRRTASPPAEIEAGHFVHDLEPLLDPLLGNVSLEITVGAPRPVVTGDPLRMEQVVLNLVKSARELLGPRGTIEVLVTTVDGPAPAPVLADGRAPDRLSGTAPSSGRWCRIAVTQGEVGFVARDFPQVTRVGWTSPDERGGTGIELATVRDALALAGGHFRLGSGDGRGTCAEAYWRMGNAGG
ncbi:MAG: hypothetical protein HY275_01945 [Gemmatimonadetes bacterium]|nr:hypothetical protein [Gemmatimonadota bacterium]